MIKKLFRNIILGQSDTPQNEHEHQEYERANNAHEEDNEHQSESTHTSGNLVSELDPETFHGTHYTVEEFDAEVDRLAKDFIRTSDRELDENGVQNVYHNIRENLYGEWNNATQDQILDFRNRNSLKYDGHVVSGFAKEDESNPLFEPVHGISLKEYSAIAVKISGGVPVEKVLKALNMEKPIWEEVNTVWPARMAEDTSFQVTTLYGQYFGEGADWHPQLKELKAEISAEAQDNLDRLKTDEEFYYELEGARSAAYEYGLDGAQWMQDTFGINLAEFQGAAMKWLEKRNQHTDSNRMSALIDHQTRKKEEYAAKFAEEQGGNVADDIDF